MEKQGLGLMSVEVIRLPDDPQERVKMRLVSMFITAFSLARMGKAEAVPGGLAGKFGDFFAGQIAALAADLKIDNAEFHKLATDQFQSSLDNATQAIAQDLAAKMAPQGQEPS